MTWRGAKKVIVMSAGLAVLAWALPAQAAHEDRMTGGGFVDVAQENAEVLRVHLGLDLPCVVEQPPTAKESRFTVRWDHNSFHLEEVEEADCTPASDPSTGGGTHDGSGAGRCQTRDPLLGTPMEVPADIDWMLTDGGWTRPSDTHGKPADPGKPTDPGPAEPTQNPDTVHITIEGPGTLCDLEAEGQVQGGQLQLHTNPHN